MEQDQKNAVFILNSRSGQAVVEYLLLMVIIVALCIGIGKGFSVLNGFLNKYIGDYTRCLMEYGELPSLGVKATELKRHMSGTGKKCDEKFQTFSFDEGRPAVGGSGGTGRNGSGSGTNSNSANNPNGQNNNSNNNNSNAAKKGNSGDANSANGGGNNGSGSDGDGSFGSKSPYKNGQIVRAGSPYGTADGGFDDSQRVRIISVDEEEDTGRKRKNKNYSVLRNDYDRSGYRPVTGRMQEEYEKTLKKKVNRAPTTTVTTINTGSGDGLMPYKKMLPQRTYEKAKEQTSDSSGFTFGGLLRFLLIAGMIVAIVIFFGGQILNYSNSKD